MFPSLPFVIVHKLTRISPSHVFQQTPSCQGLQVLCSLVTGSKICLRSSVASCQLWSQQSCRWLGGLSYCLHVSSVPKQEWMCLVFRNEDRAELCEARLSQRCLLFYCINKNLYISLGQGPHLLTKSCRIYILGTIRTRAN